TGICCERSLNNELVEPSRSNAMRREWAVSSSVGRSTETELYVYNHHLRRLRFHRRDVRKRGHECKTGRLRRYPQSSRSARLAIQLRQQQATARHTREERYYVCA